MCLFFVKQPQNSLQTVVLSPCQVQLHLCIKKGKAMQENLIAWIEGNQDYDQGLSLYQRYGSSAMLKKVLAQGNTSFNRAKLLAEIQKLYAAQPVQRPEPAIVPLQDRPADELEAELTQERKQAHQQAAYLKAQLPLIQSQQKRKAIAFQILALHDRNNEIWAMLEYKAKHGFFPNQLKAELEVQAGLEVPSLAELKRQLLVINPKISRIKNVAEKSGKLQELLQEKFRLTQLIAQCHAV